jgi:PIN domain nuclease of toxin-antitoxin system
LKALIDTSVFLKLAFDPESIPRALRRDVDNAEARFLSSVSVWEMAIKASIEKLKLPEPVDSYVRTRMRAMQLAPLDVTIEHAAAVEMLPWHHRDPFDRLLVAQAMCENLTLLTIDPSLTRYFISLLRMSKSEAGQSMMKPKQVLRRARAV